MKTLPEISLRMVKSAPADYVPTVIRSANDGAEFLEWMRELPEEKFVVLHLDTNLTVTGMQVISHGTINSSLVHPREVFKAAVIANSHAIMLAHNHPSGTNRASFEDLEVTEQLIAAGKVLGIKVIDHLIIVADYAKTTVSIREEYTEIKF